MEKLDQLLKSHTPHEIAQVAKCRTTDIVYFVNTRTLPEGIDWNSVSEQMLKPEPAEPEAEGESPKRSPGRPPKDA